MHDSNPIVSSVEKLLITTSAAADMIARDLDDFEAVGADFIIGNLAVLTSRLTADDFTTLPKELQDQFHAVAFMASDVAPADQEDLARRPKEDDSTYEYRASIVEPIHSLQRHLRTNAYDPSDQLEISKLRFAVDGASQAFSAVINETRELPAVAETIPYFNGKAGSAIRRAVQFSIARSAEN